MKNQITVRETVTDKDVALFWEELYNYFIRDIFPKPEDEDREYFLSDEYSSHMQKMHERENDRCYYLFFRRDGKDIGFALPVLYTSEDGKFFIMEFCVFPEFRGNGTGKACAEALLDWARERGMLYAELNCGEERRIRFWQRVGFIKNGSDEWGEPLMLLPPVEDVSVTIEMLKEPSDWQLLKLLNGYLREIEEEALSEDKQEKLQKAVREEKIRFFIAKRGTRAVGMCSVSMYWSSFSCDDVAVFEDFYIEPVFRRKGIARMLAQAAQIYCAEKGILSLSVCCADCDRGMYRNLGFETRLGNTLAHII